MRKLMKYHSRSEMMKQFGFEIKLDKLNPKLQQHFNNLTGYYNTS